MPVKNEQKEMYEVQSVVHMLKRLNFCQTSKYDTHYTICKQIKSTTTCSHLGQCPAIAQIRGQYFQDYYLSVNDIFDNQHITTIVNFANPTKRLIVPEELDQTGVTYNSL